MDTATSSTPATVVPLKGQPQSVPAWPRAAQLATVFLLGVATTLLIVHACRGLRWGSRPTELGRGTLAAYQIDLNRADRAELLQVPGIGSSLAQRIQEYRGEHGAFQSVSDLRQVQGIGPTTLERLRPWLWVPPEGVDRDAGSTKGGSKAAVSNKDAGRRTSAGKKEIALGELININQATATELQRLPGIGPKRAQQIVEERQKRPFASIDELRRVAGIGPKTMERLRPYVTVETEPMRIVTAGGS
jgi:competence protein ComEA